MQLKFIAAIQVKPHNMEQDFFTDLPFSKGTGKIEMNSKQDDNGLFWTTKITATLKHDIPMLAEPIIVRVRLRDRYYTIGTEEMPANATIKEGVLVDLTIEYQSKHKLTAIKKVLSIAPDCE